jgi:hypothetical protein
MRQVDHSPLLVGNSEKVCCIADVCKCVCACVRAASQAMSESRIATTREGKYMTTALVVYIRRPRPRSVHMVRISSRVPDDELTNLGVFSWNRPVASARNMESQQYTGEERVAIPKSVYGAPAPEKLVGVCGCR